MHSLLTSLLGSDQLAAVVPFRVDHLLASEVTVDQQRHCRCPVIRDSAPAPAANSAQLTCGTQLPSTST
jgi:hypothetical protein